jgi:hypothetical protein
MKLRAEDVQGRNVLCNFWVRFLYGRHVKNEMTARGFFLPLLSRLRTHTTV